MTLSSTVVQFLCVFLGYVAVVGVWSVPWYIGRGGSLTMQSTHMGYGALKHGNGFFLRYLVG